MRAWADKFREVLLSVLPIVLLVLALGVFVVPLEPIRILRFVLGAFCLMAGLTVFLMGVDLGISPLGSRLGEAVIRWNRVWVVAIAGLLLGFLVSIAEPDLHILGNQVELVTGGWLGKWTLVLTVSAGIAVLMATGLLRVLYNTPLYWLLTGLYSLILLVAPFVSPEFLAISFDASGATTGAMTVPFIMAMALGIALKKKDSKASEKDSFGLVAIVSAGAILSVLLMSLFTRGIDIADSIDFPVNDPDSILGPFATQLQHQALEAFFAILPLFLVFLAGQFLFLNLKSRTVLRMTRGFGFAWLGLVLIFVGAQAGFMEVGREIGTRLAREGRTGLLLGIGFLLGFLTILAEPAVHVLTRQIEDVTSGSVRRAAVLSALSLGVGLSVGLSVLRILLPPLQLWHILLPGYLLSILLAHIGSKLFVGIAFDSGGVASGPMTATFILAYTQGAANASRSANVLVDGFGVIALVALTPIITLQILGLLYRRKALAKGGISRG